MNEKRVRTSELLALESIVLIGVASTVHSFETYISFLSSPLYIYIRTGIDISFEHLSCCLFVCLLVVRIPKFKSRDNETLFVHLCVELRFPQLDRI